jgi:hypothetical protein
LFEPFYSLLVSLLDPIEFLNTRAGSERPRESASGLLDPPILKIQKNTLDRVLEQLSLVLNILLSSSESTGLWECLHTIVGSEGPMIRVVDLPDPDTVKRHENTPEVV